jgi:FKBP-type peptidyl-prolyl cis-trans isomerase FklB
MNKRVFIVSWCIVVLAGSPVFGQEKGELKNDRDKLSYALGASMAHNLKQYEVDLNMDIYIKGMKDVFTGNKELLTEQEIASIIAKTQENVKSKMQDKAMAQLEKNKKDGETFLAENKKKAGVKTLPSGLQYKVIAEGKGKSPKDTDTVTVNYRGTFIDGIEFDSSYKRGEPATFAVNGVIKGWTEALTLMKEGAKWQLFIPANLAYAERGAPGVPPNSTLIFEVELIKIGAK